MPYTLICHIFSFVSGKVVLLKQLDVYSDARIRFGYNYVCELKNYNERLQ